MTARPSRWFEWRYAALGMGSGALVGLATGLLAGLIFVVIALVTESSLDGFTLGTAVITLPLLGIVVGLFAGGVVGIPTGLVLALVGPHVTAMPRARRVMGVTTFVAGMLSAPLALWLMGITDGEVGGLDPRGAFTWIVLAAPCLAGAYLVSRWVPSVLRERARLAGPADATSTDPHLGAQSLHS
ncbi:hypothetical protein ACQBAT_14755 [Ornithinimicrobium sp. Y1847]|uniref:hypothetical protein n=1 Tax=unclassified Ornithinimicrobium TaxID=2615080 RepID=UPI003B67A28E